MHSNINVFLTKLRPYGIQHAAFICCFLWGLNKDWFLLFTFYVNCLHVNMILNDCPTLNYVDTLCISKWSVVENVMCC